MQVKQKLSAVVVSLVFAFSAAGISFATEQPPPPPEMDAWLKAARLGSYDTAPQDWAEIGRMAEKEGEVIIYSASSRMAKVAKKFMEKYPAIKVTSYDLGSVKTIEKTIREQDAKLY